MGDVTPGYTRVRNDKLAELMLCEAEVERLREALDWIYAEPEDPIKVQKRAREVLDG